MSSGAGRQLPPPPLRRAAMAFSACALNQKKAAQLVALPRRLGVRPRYSERMGWSLAASDRRTARLLGPGRCGCCWPGVREERWTGFGYCLAGLCGDCMYGSLIATPVAA